MTDNPIPGTPAYAAAGATLIAQNAAELWALDRMIAASATPSSVSVTTGTEASAVEAARILGVTGKPGRFPASPATPSDGYWRDGVVDGISVSIASYWRLNADGEVAA